MAFATLVTLNVWNTRDNAIKFTVKDNGAVKDLSAVTRMVLGVGATNVVDTDIEAAGTITWDSVGVVTMKLGSLAIADGTYQCELVAYDPANTNGVMLVHPNAVAQLTLVFETD